MGILHPDLMGEREWEKNFCTVQPSVGNKLTLQSAPIYSGKLPNKYVAAPLIMISCYCKSSVSNSTRNWEFTS